MDRGKQARIVAGLMFLVLLAPFVLCFTSPGVEQHACCGSAAMRDSTAQNCCMMSAAPVPVQPASTPVVQFSDVALLSSNLALSMPPIPTGICVNWSFEAAPPGVLERFPSNLRI